MQRIGYLASLLLCVLLILLAPPGDLRSVATFLLLWVLPGVAWGVVRRGRWLEGVGLGITINVILILVINYLPGKVRFDLATAVFFLAASVPCALWRRHGVVERPYRLLPVPVALLLLAILFRVPHLGYSEFQGDEGLIMVRAAAALEGDDEELFLHAKGPVEILIPMASWSLGGAINETWARMPFSWISVLGVLAMAKLGARWFSQRTGWFAGMALAINGFLVAFGRIVQYQGVVVFMVLLALLAFDRYRSTGRGPDLVIGALFFAVAGLSHYDSVLFVPAAAVLLVLSIASRSPTRFHWRHMILAVLLASSVFALFYIPFIANPNFGRTAQYLAGDRVGSGIHLNFGSTWVMSTVYNSSYYIVVLVLLAIASLASRRGGLAAWLLFLVPALFYLVLVFDPRTHLYTIYVGLCLLAGNGADFVLGTATNSQDEQNERRPRIRVKMVLATGLYILCAGYTWMVFVDHVPEYQRTFPQHKSGLYWLSYDEMPLFGRFGFPHQAGWHAVSALMADGEISGTYASNEEQEITDFYSRQAPRTHCSQPDVYIVAENVQDEVPIDWEEIDANYGLAGVVSVLGETRIRWFLPADLAPAMPLEVDASQFRQWWYAAEVAPPGTGGSHVVNVVLGDQIKLVGYDLDTDQVTPGGEILLTLYWQPLVPLERNYQVFTHLYDGEMRGQHDGAPECAHNPTTRWEPGQIIPDPHRIEVSPDTSPGRLPLLVGMYDLITRDRLGVTGGEGDSIFLTDLIIQ